MTNTLFLTPISPSSQATYPNEALGYGDIAFFNYSAIAQATLTTAEAQTLVNGGVASAIAEAGATYLKSPGPEGADFATLFNFNNAGGTGGTYQGQAISKTEIVAAYNVRKGDTLSFEFAANLFAASTEIEDDYQYSHVSQQVGFLVLDLDHLDWFGNPTIIGHFGIEAELESSEHYGEQWLDQSSNVKKLSDQKGYDVDGDNGKDSLSRFVYGEFKETFDYSSRIAIVKVTHGDVNAYGDFLLGSRGLGNDVKYGTIYDDHLYTGHSGGKLYGSFGNDKLEGNNGKDTLEGGWGDDHLIGWEDNDKLHGSYGNDELDGESGHDFLVGGEGNDDLDGGSGNDTLVGVDFYSGNAGSHEIDSLIGGWGKDIFVLGDKNQAYYRAGGDHDYGVIQDFERGTDKIFLYGKASDYRVEYVGWDRQYWGSNGTKDGLPSGSRIYYTANNTNDLVGIVDDVNLKNDLSNSSIFAYNQTITV
jgi:Ca2+-binding RTX toxin-like protein